MAVSHVKTSPAGDWTGTVTVFNSQGSTTTTAATALMRPSDWNSAHNQFYTLSGNTSNASTASGTNVVLQGVGGVTLIGSTGTIGVSAAAPGTATMWYPFNEAINVVALMNRGTLYINPVPTPPTAANGVLHVDRAAFPIQVSNASNSTGSITVSIWFGLYTRDNSSLTRVHSTSLSSNWTFSGTNSASLQHGIRLFTIPWTTTIDDGRYYVGVIYSSTSGGANGTAQPIYLSQLTTPYSGIMGAASNRSVQWPMGFGVYSAATGALPASIAFSQLDGTSATIAARPPSWFMISGTA